jgi:tRNA(fMet)-specific endonuclease VapC
LSVYLLDTNTCVEVLRNRNQHVVRRFTATAPKNIRLCSVVKGELFYGARKGPIGPNDTMIAAIALNHGLTVTTHNTNEFSRVAGLQVEDWTLPLPCSGCWSSGRCSTAGTPSEPRFSPCDGAGCRGRRRVLFLSHPVRTFTAYAKANSPSADESGAILGIGPVPFSCPRRDTAMEQVPTIDSGLSWLRWGARSPTGGSLLPRHERRRRPNRYCCRLKGTKARFPDQHEIA